MTEKTNRDTPNWLSWIAPVLFLIAAVVGFATGHPTDGWIMLALLVVFGVVGVGPKVRSRKRP